MTEYNNPIPVAVMILPVKENKKYIIDNVDFRLNLTNVLYLKRNIEPQKDKWALPGGFVNEMESIEVAAVRELFEETGYQVDVNQVNLFKSEITPNNRNLIFSVGPDINPKVVKEMKDKLVFSTEIKLETNDFCIGNVALNNTAFPLHQKVIGIYLDKVNSLLLNALDFNYDKLTITKLVEELKNDGYLTPNFEYQFGEERIVKAKNNLKRM